MDTMTWFEIQAEVVGILHCTNPLGKGMKPAMGKQEDRLGSLTLFWQLVLEKENFEFEPDIYIYIYIYI